MARSPTAARSETAYVEIKIRMREPLRRQIEDAARRGEVSMNAEMIDRLEKSFRRETEFGGPLTAALLKQFAAFATYTAETTTSGFEGEGADMWIGDREAFNTVADHWIRELEEMRANLAPVNETDWNDYGRLRMLMAKAEDEGEKDYLRRIAKDQSQKADLNPILQREYALLAKGGRQ